MELQFPWIEFIEVLVAALLGGLIGLDRELRERPAGLRTHMMVAMSSALFVTLAEALISIDVDRELVRSDPVRIVEAIATGVAFLGAGTIFRSSADDAVKGLTTAASILFAAALGVAVALNLWLLAISSTLFALVVLRTIGAWERWLHAKRAASRSPAVASGNDSGEDRPPPPP
jgi:putative Mg2+ transporter-C (MgtC) family protein